MVQLGPGAELDDIDAIGGQEIQYAKGHKYLTLVYQIDLGVTRLLWVGKERTIESFQGFFKVIGDEVASKNAFVCGSPIYLKVIREKCSEALHILDRFHIVAKMTRRWTRSAPGNRAESRRRAVCPCSINRAGFCSNGRKISSPSSASGCATCSATT